MSQTFHHSANDYYFIIILLLIAYVMSSAPRYVREFRSQPEKTLPVPTAPAVLWQDVVKAYTIQPYINAIEQLRSETQLSDLVSQ